MRTFIAILISIVTLISCDNFEPSPLVGRYTYGNIYFVIWNLIQ